MDDYDLAQQLKEAGFPQPVIGQGAGTGSDDDDMGDGSYLTDGSKYAYAPTLEELMEACGKDFVLECVASGGLHPWTAGVFVDREGEIERSQTAETAIEAVAKLWLALHGKQQS